LRLKREKFKAATSLEEFKALTQVRSIARQGEVDYWLNVI
jgi:hypothetical protein